MKPGALYRGDGCVVAQVWRADNVLTRLRGLLARPPLAAGEGLLLAPCGSVHTLGMGYPLDLLFLSREGRVLEWRAGLRPWRAAMHRGAYATLELAVGGLEVLAPVRDERLQWRPTRPATVEAQLPQGQGRTT